MIKRIGQFLEVDLWRMKLQSLPSWKRHLYGTIKIVFISIKEFIDDKCAEKASALTFLSMLSLVPVLALLFTVASAFGIRESVETELERYFKGQTEILDKVSPYVDNILAQQNIVVSDSLQSTDSTSISPLNYAEIESDKTSNKQSTEGGGIDKSIIAISSIGFLLYTVIRLLMNIESAFNDMWDIKKSRRWERKISDYVTVILLGPILLIVASSATVFVQNTIQTVIINLEIFDGLKSGIVFLLKLLPYTILWFLLFGLYLIFPNTRVKFFPAFLSGIVAGTLYQLNQQAFISLQFAFSRYDAIYGSFAFLPLFLIWLQISWMIVLFGAEVTYATQYVNSWSSKSDKLKLSLNHQKKLMLLLLFRIIKKFENNKGAMSLLELSQSVNVPRKYINDICNYLEKSHLISAVDSEEKAFLPALDINQLDVQKVISKYENIGMADFDDNKSEEFLAIEILLREMDTQWSKSKKNILLKNLNLSVA